MKDLFNDDIRNGMAALFWNSAWADYQEELGRLGEPHANLSGVNIYDVSDEPDEVQREELRRHVEQVVEEIEYKNSASLDELLDRATAADDAEADPERFGECLAYMSMGSGVSWFDDHVHFEIEVPYREHGWVYLTWGPTLQDELDAWIVARDRDGLTDALREEFEENGSKWVHAAMRRTFNEGPRELLMISLFPDPDEVSITATLRSDAHYSPGWGSMAWEDSKGDTIERPEYAEAVEKTVDSLHELLTVKLKDVLLTAVERSGTIHVNHHGVMAIPRDR